MRDAYNQLTSFHFSLTFLLILFSFALQASTPLVYGDDLTAWINTTGEMHTYTFEGNSGDRIFIRARGTSNGVDACIELFDPTGTPIGADCDDGGYVTIDGYDLAMTGTYTLTVKDHEDNDTGFYGLGLQIVNNPSFTTTINCDTDLAETLSHQAEMDAFSYTGEAGDVIVIQMKGAVGNIETWVRLYDSAGNIIAEATPVGGLTRINTFSLPAAGTYTILAMDVNGNDTGDYGFSLQVVDTDACAEVLECGSITGEISILAQMHAYKIEATAGDLIYLHMRGETGLEAELELYDATGNEIAADNPNGGTAKIENFLIPATGTYFVMARDRMGNDIGTYGLSYQNVGNLSCATELSCEADLNGDINYLAEMDIYYFEASQGDQIIAQMRSTNTSFESELFLCNSSGTILAEDSPGGGMCEIEDAIIPEDGLYFIFARDKHGNDFGDYGFSFQKLDASCATLFECGDGTINSSINSLTAIDAYHFTGTAGDLISIDFEETGSALEPLLYVYDPNNNRVIDETASHDIHVEDFELPETGTYIVLAMDRNGNDTGGYTLDITCPFAIDDTPPTITGCADMTFTCTEINGSNGTPVTPFPTGINWDPYNIVITFDSPVESTPGTCLFGDMVITDNGCGGINTACFGNTLQFTPDWATCWGPFKELPFCVDFGNGLIVTFEENGNLIVDAYPNNGGGNGSTPGDATLIEEWLSSVTATDDSGTTTITNDFDPTAFSCAGGAAGTQVVTFTAVDEHDNVSTCTATVSVTDDAAPVFDWLPSPIADINASDELPVQEELSATDGCGNATVVASVDPYEVNPCGDYSITYRWTATDDCGNTNEVAFTFDVLFDASNMEIFCPQDITVNLDEEDGVQLNAYELWGMEADCQFEFFHAHSLHFTCDDIGENPITFSVISQNQVLTVCDFTVTVQGECPTTYCDSWGTANGNKFIDEISVSTYTNNSGNDYGYGDYTSEEIHTSAATTLPLTVTPSSIDNSKRKWRIWIDFDQNGVFDNNEKVYDEKGHGTLYGNIEIPANALQGATRMRVSMKTGWAPDPCSTFTTGEVEDYTVVIAEAPECGAIPDPWVNKNIGDNDEGSACYVAETDAFVVSSTGEDIYGSSDEFHFVYQELCSEGYIQARVASMTNTASYALAGVMMRKSLEASSANTALLVRPENGMLFQNRYSEGGTTYDSSLDGEAPTWVKLERTPTMIVAYTSDDGQNWEQVYYTEVELDGCVYVGLAVSSNNEEEANTSVFEQVTVEAYDGFSGGGNNYNFNPTTPSMEENTAKASSEAEVRKEVINEFEISCYPNPTSHYINVDVTRLSNKPGTIKMYNNLGQMVWTSDKKHFDQEVYQIDVQALRLPAGMYVVSVHYGKKATSKTIYVNNERN